MKTFIDTLKPAIISLLLLTVLTGIIYPLFIFGIGQIFFHRKANGTIFYYKDKEVIGSEWIGQNFTKPEYFHPRPSAAGNGYDGANSSGSNLGPTSQKLIDSLRQRVSSYRSENSLSSDKLIPADAVTASGSGLDPHIGLMNAQLQAARVASARGMSLESINQVIRKFTEGPTLGIFGEKRINVLRLNLELDKITIEGSP